MELAEIIDSDAGFESDSSIDVLDFAFDVGEFHETQDFSLDNDHYASSGGSYVSSGSNNYGRSNSSDISEFDGAHELSIVWSAYSGSRNVEGAGRMFKVSKNDADGYHHASNVAYAFIRQKLDPEMHRKMPGLNIVYTGRDGFSCFEMENSYGSRGLSAYHDDEDDFEEEELEIEMYDIEM